jgi:proteic killer suppression protein
VIQGFKDADTAELFEKRKNHQWSKIASVAVRKLDMIHAAALLSDLKVPPGNKLEALARDRKGQHSIRINDQYRICFVWKADGAHEVENTDYH